MRKPRPVFQFKISLQGVEPLVWRRIQISDLCTFWSLHVAIQDSMGWKDYHLHQFSVGEYSFGIPIDDGEQVLPSWEFKVRDYLNLEQPKMLYEYDFGDDWRHDVVLEAICDKDPRFKYPLSIAGENACPPEDVGGIHGYESFLESLKDPTHPEHAGNQCWIGGEFNPNRFDPAVVRFSNPRTRWKKAFTRNTA